MKLPFWKWSPKRKDMLIFVGGYPYKWRKRSPLQEPTVAMEFTINRSPFAGKLKEITVFGKKTWRSVGWVSMEFVVPDLKLKKCRCCWIWCFSYEFHFFVKIRLLFLFWLGDGLIVFRNYKLWKTAWGCSSNFVGWIGRWVNQADLPLTIVKFRKKLVETNQSLHQKRIEQK